VQEQLGGELLHGSTGQVFLFMCESQKYLNSLPAKFVLVGMKLVLFGRYVLKFYLGIVQ
jgi:hypothetical protein